MAYRRKRTGSQYEECNISSFVESCINFKPNVTFHTTSEGPSLDGGDSTHSRTVLLLGQQSQLKDKEKVAQFFPYYSDAVERAVAVHATLSGSARSQVAEVRPDTNILIGAVPTVASRHNCALRPDTITAIVRDAVTHARRKTESGIQGVLDIYCCEAENLLCVAVAIARGANRNFSAKMGFAEKSYLDPGIPVRVVFAPNTKALSFTEASRTFGGVERHALDAAALTVQLCQRLVDASTNLLDTTTFTEIAAGWIAKLKEQGHNVSIDIISGEDLRENGYGGIYGVGKAAEFPPHLVTLSYNPKGGIAPQEKIALVGKGIVYDTGGLSIKSGVNMCGMKRDMGGAATVFCGFLALVMVEAPQQLSTVLCLADNAVGPRSQRNDDIVRMRSGKTVEINNTDAEGRLVLGDGVYHASALLAFTPDIIVDMATLTGAQGIATGKRHAALYANKKEIEDRIFEAGLKCGDLCFPLVYTPEFHAQEFNSAVADLRNSVESRANAQSSCAAYFVESHLDAKFNGAWAHIDMAAPVCQCDATGYGVGLLLQTFAPQIYGSK